MPVRSPLPARPRSRRSSAAGRVPPDELLLGMHVSTAGGLVGGVRRARALGLTAIQLFTSSPRRWEPRPLSAAEADEFRRARAEAGIRAAFAHDSYLTRLGTRDEPLLVKSLASFLSEMERSRRLGLEGVVVHPSAYPGCGRDEALWRVAEVLNALVAHQRGRGWPRILLETTPGHGGGLWRRFEDLALLLERLEPAERFAVCLDTCHVFAAGYELRTEAGYRATWREFASTIGLERLDLIHANDSLGGLGERRDLHAHIGEGQLGLPTFELLMRDHALAGVPKVTELPKVRDGVAMDEVDIGLLRRLAGHPGRRSAR